MGVNFSVFDSECELRKMADLMESCKLLVRLKIPNPLSDMPVINAHAGSHVYSLHAHTIIFSIIALAKVLSRINFFFLGGGGASVLHCMYVFCARHDCSLLCVLYVYIHQGVFHNDEGGGGVIFKV